MSPRKKPARIFRWIQRESAERYLFLTLLSFAASVTFTRLFLSVTNYPQIASGDLHIAHVLWGGLLMYVAALLPLLFANRSVYPLGALLAGAGVGLFIDEVGKFITAKNDYFYPVAASIIYVIFLLTLFLFINIRNQGARKQRNELAEALETLWESLHHPLSEGDQKILLKRLENTINHSSQPRQVELGKALMAYLSPASVSIGETEQGTPVERSTKSGWLSALFSNRNLRLLLIPGLLLFGLITLKNPVTVLLVDWLPPAFITWLESLHFGRQVEAAAAPLWSNIRLALELGVGLLLLASTGLLTARKDRLGSLLAYSALLLSLTTINILLFYFEQFSTISSTAFQFLLLGGILLFRRRLGKSNLEQAT